MRVSDYLKQQYAKIIELENEILRLQAELNELRNRPTYNIERMEYQFDQLKIETLEGTLNIGITPDEGGKGLKDLSIGNKGSSYPHPDWNDEKEKRFREVKRRIDRYLQEEIHREVIRLSREMNQKIDPFAVSFIVEDLKRQVDERLRHYVMSHSEWSLDEIESKTKEDLIQAVRDFIAVWPKMEE